MFTFVARLPQPLKGLYVAFFVAFAGTFASFFLGGERANALAGGLLGVVAALIGLTLVTNLNGAAAGLAESMKTYRPLGVDYSRSFFATPGYARVFGMAMLAVGVVFVTTAATTL